MPKRHDSLIPLTHDHHHALVQARRLGEGADRGSPEGVSQARSFLEFFDSDTIGHFREEEESIFPLVIYVSEAREPLTRLLLEHVQLHALVAKLRAEVDDGEVDPETMTLIASLLQRHIRFEEKVLFPLIESLAADALASVQLSPRDRRASSPADR
jgi:hemerythrin-like domain-containing protein